jgi:hypothetical protein
LLAVQGLDLVGLLQTVPHHGCTGVGIWDVCHPRIPAVRSCCYCCCSWHCWSPSSLFLVIYNDFSRNTTQRLQFLLR